MLTWALGEGEDEDEKGGGEQEEEGEGDDASKSSNSPHLHIQMLDQSIYSNIRIGITAFGSSIAPDPRWAHVLMDNAVFRPAAHLFLHSLV